MIWSSLVPFQYCSDQVASFTGFADPRSFVEKEHLTRADVQLF